MKTVENLGRAFLKPLFPYLKFSPEDELRNNKYRLLYDYSHQLYDEEVQRFKDLEDKSFKLLTALSVISLLYIPTLNWVLSVTKPWCVLSVLVIPMMIVDVAFFLRAWKSLSETFKLTEVPKMPSDNNLLGIFNDDNEHINSLYYHLYLGYNESIIQYKIVNDKKSKYISDGHKHLQKGFTYFIAILSFAVFGMILESL